MGKIIEVSGVFKNYDKKKVLEKVSFSLEEGQSMIFTKTPGLEQVPASELWTKPNSRNYVDYLLYVKNPSVGNMTYILNTIAAKNKHNLYDRAATQGEVE